MSLLKISNSFLLKDVEKMHKKVSNVLGRLELFPLHK